MFALLEANAQQQHATIAPSPCRLHGGRANTHMSGKYLVKIRMFTSLPMHLWNDGGNSTGLSHMLRLPYTRSPESVCPWHVKVESDNDNHSKLPPRLQLAVLLHFTSLCFGTCGHLTFLAKLPRQSHNSLRENCPLWRCNHCHICPHRAGLNLPWILHLVLGWMNFLLVFQCECIDVVPANLEWPFFVRVLMHHCFSHVLPSYVEISFSTFQGTWTTRATIGEKYTLAGLHHFLYESRRDVFRSILNGRSCISGHHAYR